MKMTSTAFMEHAFANPLNGIVMARLKAMQLGQCFLTAGCLFQAIWNLRSGRRPDWGVKDYDVFYFDEDVSYATEDAVIARARHLFADLEVSVDLKNQARVHLWFEQKNGYSYPKLRSTTDGIDRFLISCTCVGIDVATNELYAPNGLQDLWDGILQINEIQPSPTMFLRKAADYQSRWPWLTIIPFAAEERIA